MIKFITNKEYEKLNRINTLPFRSHYIPYDKNQKFEFVHGILDKTKSNEFVSLNGEWNFKAYERLEDLEFVDEDLPDLIEVPCAVQCKGYDYFQYTNIIYPFSFNPPYIKEDIPTFHYRRKFKIDCKNNVFLVFEGVDACFYVYVNNQYVGFSQITHSKSEFDITRFVNEGENTIDVIVLKWCSSSYLEDQDKFRFSGIIRDVYILSRPDNYIWDYKIEPIYKEEKWFLHIKNLSKVKLNIEFEGQTTILEAGEESLIEKINPNLWTDTNPFLYDVIISNNKEKILERIGFRRVEIREGIFLINGKHQKLKGVNRHESTPEKGSTISIEETYKDLLLIKEINANSIRTSHYPDIPEFYDLCNVLGIYVLNEADVETHGAAGESFNLESWQAFANSGVFDSGVTEREISLYERDKNKTCVIIWSLGNESNWGTMFYEGADYIYSHDSRPIHYENLWSMFDKTDYYTSRVDICSRMYPSVDDIKKQYLEDEKEKRPLLLCEYTHAMGNSCGDVKDYWDLINNEERIIGAFVWEFCDHAVLVNGQLKYGSDFPERHHDGNFCADGLFSPYREYKSSTEEVKAVYSSSFVPPKKLFKKRDTVKDAKELRFATNNDGELITLEGKNNLLLTPFRIHLTRADIDNEMHIGDKLSRVRNLRKETSVTGTHSFSTKFFDTDGSEALSLTYAYELKDKVLCLHCSWKKKDDLYLQRLGFQFSLSLDNKELTYFGFGPGESYVDKHNYTKIDKYSFDVSTLKMSYLKSQEFGNHFYVSYFETKNLLITADKPFEFSALPWSEEEMLKNTHNYELPEAKMVYINIDLSQAGVGSSACGPVLETRYCVPNEGSNTFYISLK